MNQTIEPDSNQTDMPSPSVAAGKCLREAREGLGLSIEDVARELRLHEKLIGALEEGDRSQLPPSAFISGYLRSYARLLGIPADQLIADYLAERVAPATYRSLDRTGMPVVTSRDLKFRATTFVVIAVSVVLFAAWWANQRFSILSTDMPQTTASSSEQHEEEAKLPEPAPLYEPHPEEADTAAAKTEDGKAAAKPGVATAGGVAGGGAQSAANQKDQLTPSVTPPVTSTANNGQQNVAGNPVAAPVTVPQAEPAKPAPQEPVVATEPLSPSIPQSTLVMEYQAASWTQVEDAKGRVLVYKTVNAGNKLQLHGVAPFKVYLGYASGVVVYYNGTLFSHAVYHRGDLARFKVGSSQDNRPLVR